MYLRCVPFRDFTFYVSKRADFPGSPGARVVDARAVHAGPRGLPGGPRLRSLQWDHDASVASAGPGAREHPPGHAGRPEAPEASPIGAPARVHPSLRFRHRRLPAAREGAGHSGSGDEVEACIAPQACQGPHAGATEPIQAIAIARDAQLRSLDASRCRAGGAEAAPVQPRCGKLHRDAQERARSAIAIA